MPSTHFEWSYVVETSKDGKEWTYSQSPFESEDEAVAYAKTLPKPVRVKAFKVTVYDTEYNGAKTGVVATVVPLVSFFCPTHPVPLVRALATSRPRCPQCHLEMLMGDGTIEELK